MEKEQEGKTNFKYSGTSTYGLFSIYTHVARLKI